MANDSRFIKAIYSIMDALTSSTQLAESMESSLNILCSILECKSGSFWMQSIEEKRVYVIASNGPEDKTGYSVNIGEGIIGAVHQSGLREIVKDGMHDPRTADTDDASLFGSLSLVVPMKTLHGSYGVLLLNDPSRPFDEDTIRVAENCCAFIALDIEEKGLAFKPIKNKNILVSLRDVIKEFQNGDELHRVLKGIDLDVYEGELLVVLGESGCGKSTMLNIIGGMDQATDGQLLIEGKDFSHPTEAELTQFRRDYIGFIFQSYNLMPNLTALENIEFIAEISQHPLESEEMLELVDLGDKAGNYPSSMSGGQQQRVCIARAIVKNPKIILADEPTAALDFHTGQDVLKLIEQIVQDRGTTVIMVTHNIEIAKMANRVIRLKDGRISSIRVNMHPRHAEELSW